MWIFFHIYALCQVEGIKGRGQKGKKGRGLLCKGSKERFLSKVRPQTSGKSQLKPALRFSSSDSSLVCFLRSLCPRPALLNTRSGPADVAGHPWNWRRVMETDCRITVEGEAPRASASTALARPLAGPHTREVGPLGKIRDPSM